MHRLGLRSWIERYRAARVQGGLVRRGLAAPRIVSRFRKNRDGAAAVEFALVASPFFVLLFAIIEITLVFFASQLLESATADASRKIMTNQTGRTFDRNAFRDEVCRQTNALMSCSGVQVDVQTYQTFGASSVSAPRTSTGAVNTGAMGFNQGNGGDIVVVRVVYEWPVLVPSFGLTLNDLPNGNRLLIATSAFRNEPFGAR